MPKVLLFCPVFLVPVFLALLCLLNTVPCPPCLMDIVALLCLVVCPVSRPVPWLGLVWLAWADIANSCHGSSWRSIGCCCRIHKHSDACAISHLVPTVKIQPASSSAPTNYSLVLRLARPQSPSVVTRQNRGSAVLAIS